MECLAVFLIMTCVFTALIGGILQRWTTGRGRDRLFQGLARRFAGQYRNGLLLSHPLVQLRYGVTSAVIREARDGGPLPGSALQVGVAWPHAEVRCAIVAAAGYSLRRGRLPDWPPMRLDDPTLAPHYFVLAHQPEEIRPFLTSGVCWHIDRLRRLGEDGRLFVLVDHGQILVQKYWRRPRGELAVQFVQGVLELYDQCMLARASGIEFLDRDEAQTLGDVTCKICGEAIGDELVYCRRCKTPHHQECWHYAGVCSVFGCRETVYLLPQHGQLPKPPLDNERRTNKPR